MGKYKIPDCLVMVYLEELDVSQILQGESILCNTHTHLEINLTYLLISPEEHLSTPDANTTLPLKSSLRNKENF